MPLRGGAWFLPPSGLRGGGFLSLPRDLRGPGLRGYFLCEQKVPKKSLKPDGLRIP